MKRLTILIAFLLMAVSPKASATLRITTDGGASNVTATTTAIGQNITSTNAGGVLHTNYFGYGLVNQGTNIFAYANIFTNTTTLSGVGQTNLTGLNQNRDYYYCVGSKDVSNGMVTASASIHWRTLIAGASTNALGGATNVAVVVPLGSNRGTFLYNGAEVGTGSGGGGNVFTASNNVYTATNDYRSGVVIVRPAVLTNEPITLLRHTNDLTNASNTLSAAYIAADTAVAAADLAIINSTNAAIRTGSQAVTNGLTSLGALTNLANAKAPASITNNYALDNSNAEYLWASNLFIATFTAHYLQKQDSRTATDFNTVKAISFDGINWLLAANPPSQAVAVLGTNNLDTPSFQYYTNAAYLNGIYVHVTAQRSTNLWHIALSTNFVSETWLCPIVVTNVGASLVLPSFSELGGPKLFITTNDNVLHIVGNVFTNTYASWVPIELHATDASLTNWSAPVMITGDGTFNFEPTTPGSRNDPMILPGMGGTNWLVYNNAGSPRLAYSTTNITNGYVIATAFSGISETISEGTLLRYLPATGKWYYWADTHQGYSLWTTSTRPDSNDWTRVGIQKLPVWFRAGQIQVAYSAKERADALAALNQAAPLNFALLYPLWLSSLVTNGSAPTLNGGTFTGFTTFNNSVQANGTLITSRLLTTNATTLSTSNNFVVCDTSAGGFTNTLPTLGITATWYQFVLTNASPQPVTFYAGSSGLINGIARYFALSNQNDFVTMRRVGSKLWQTSPVVTPATGGGGPALQTNGLYVASAPTNLNFVGFNTAVAASTLNITSVVAGAEWTSNTTMTAIGGVKTNTSGQPALWDGSVKFVSAVTGVGAAQFVVKNLTSGITNINRVISADSLAALTSSNSFDFPICTNCSYSVTDVSGTGATASLGGNVLWTGISGAQGPAGATGPAGSPGYLEYSILLAQANTDDPVAIVLTNTLGGTVVWTYTDIGSYSGTLAGAFKKNKTQILLDHHFFFSGSQSFCDDSDSTTNALKFVIGTGADQNGGSPADGILTNFPIIIRVYP